MAIEFDEQLRIRLLAFQQHHGLADDGWAGARTWGKLVEVGYGGSVQPQSALLGNTVANDAAPMAGPVGGDLSAPDHRTDEEIAHELERRTGKSIGELTLELGLGPIPITARELEARLIASHKLRPVLPDNSKHTVLDAVKERHPTMDGRFVTSGVVGKPEVVDRLKAAGEEEHAAQLQQNLATLAGGARLPAKSSPNAAPKPNAPKPTTPAGKGPIKFDKVDQQRLGTGKPANDHTAPTQPAAKVIPIRPPVEAEPVAPRGEIMLDTGTGPARSVGEPVRNAARKNGGGSGGVHKSPAPGTKPGGTGQQKQGASNPGQPATPRTRLPRSDGAWDGEEGKSEWVSFKPEVNRVTGSQGIVYRNGKPVLKGWAVERVILTKMQGVDDKDFSSARKGLRNRFPGRWNSLTHVEEWEKGRQADNHGNQLGEAHTWHHEPDLETMSLVPTALHENIPHAGGGSGIRSGGTPSRDTAPLDTNPL